MKLSNHHNKTIYSLLSDSLNQQKQFYPKTLGLVSQVIRKIIPNSLHRVLGFYQISEKSKEINHM